MHCLSRSWQIPPKQKAVLLLQGSRSAALCWECRFRCFHHRTQGNHTGLYFSYMGAPFRLSERQRTDSCCLGDLVLLFLEVRHNFSTLLKDHAIWIKNQLKRKRKEKERGSEVSLQHGDGACLRTIRKTGSPKTY